jgi:hypothetical protein
MVEFENSLRAGVLGRSYVRVTLPFRRPSKFQLVVAFFLSLSRNFTSTDIFPKPKPHLTHISFRQPFGKQGTRMKRI